MKDLNIAVLQVNPIWENKEQNLCNISDIIGSMNNETDLIVLPEMFATGFSMNVKMLSETMEGETVNWMRRQAFVKKAIIMGSAIIKENRKFYNRLIIAFPNGDIKYYNKRHLFSVENEHLYYSKGINQLLFKINNWKIMPLICYDLRFPAWSRNHYNYDVLIYIANWPEKRIDHWNKLLFARAIENQCYVIGCNRTGTDGNDIGYNGKSIAIDYSGQVVNIFAEDGEGVMFASLNISALKQYRKSFPVLNDRDQFKLI
ncbi:MAG: amidohydrolase [Bacteroidales bacterium]|nr:amidohydrolase [Bacteroidales bacterium]